MPIVEDRILGGPGQALQNLLTGDVGGAGAALLKPESMTPKERDALLKELGIEKHPFASALRVLTNPAVLVSAAISMKFPVPSAANIFKVSEQLAGYTSRFPILGKLASMHSWFRGTPVPEIYTKIIHDISDFKSRYAGEMATALKGFQQSTGRDVTNAEQKLIGMWLDGLHKSTPGVSKKPLAPFLENHMTPQVLSLAKKTRGILDGVWGETFGNLDSRKKIMRALERAQKAGFDSDVSRDIMAWAASGQKLPDYFPRRLIATEDEFLKFVSAVTGTGASAGKMSDFAKRATERMQRVVGPEAHLREGLMMPSLRELREVEHVLDPAVYAEMKERFSSKLLKQVRNEIGDGVAGRLSKLPFEEMTDAVSASKVMDLDDAHRYGILLKSTGPRQYSVTAYPVLNKYVHTMSTTYGWSAQGGGEKMFDEILKMRIASSDARAKTRLAMLESTYIPMALGWGDFKQALKSQKWHQDRMRMAVALDTPQIRSLLGTNLHEKMTNLLIDDKSPASLINLHRKGAGYFYLTTLGGNPGSAIKNLLQPVLTTGPVVGFRTMANGMLTALKKSHSYFENRYSQGLSHDEALRKAYPEFAAEGLVGSPLVDETLQNVLTNSYTLGSKIAGGAGKTTEKIARAMMSLFSMSEHAGRLGTFEAGMIHAGRTGLKGPEATKFARKLTEATQFLTGPQNTPYALLGLPPLSRQLAQFPLRMAEFTTSTAFSLGSAEKNVLGVNPGTFSRMLLGSVLTYEAGNAVGVDLSDALFSSAVPGFAEPGKVFAPFPLVPPVWQIMGAAAMDYSAGEFDQLRRSLALLVPGGVGLSRAVGMVPGGAGAARLMGRSYADYESPSPTGRTAVYTSEGQLKGFFSPWDVFAMAVGVRTGDRIKEEELLRTVVANRDDIRASKANFMDAVLKNDASRVESTASAFKTRYGFGIPVSEKDVRNAQLRRSIPRLTSVIQTLPPGPIRQQYIQLVSQAMGAGAEDFLGMPPEQMSQPGAARNAAAGRVGPARTSTQFTATGGVVPGQLSYRKYDVEQMSPF